MKKMTKETNMDSRRESKNKQNYSEEHISARKLGRMYEADYSMICQWILEYIDKGEAAFK